MIFHFICYLLLPCLLFYHRVYSHEVLQVSIFTKDFVAIKFFLWNKWFVFMSWDIFDEKHLRKHSNTRPTLKQLPSNLTYLFWFKQLVSVCFWSSFPFFELLSFHQMCFYPFRCFSHHLFQALIRLYFYEFFVHFCSLRFQTNFCLTLHNCLRHTPSTNQNSIHSS